MTESENERADPEYPVDTRLISKIHFGNSPLQEKLEEYLELEEPFKNFLANTIQQLTREQSIAKHLKTVYYPSARYEEFIDGKWVHRELKELKTRFIVKREYVEGMDLISLRKEIFDACSKAGKELDHDIIQRMKTEATNFDTTRPDFFDVFLEKIREMKKDGGNPMIVLSEDTARWLRKEVLRPEIQKKIRLHMAEEADDKL